MIVSTTFHLGVCSTGYISSFLHNVFFYYSKPAGWYYMTPPCIGV